MKVTCFFYLINQLYNPNVTKKITHEFLIKTDLRQKPQAAETLYSQTNKNNKKLAHSLGYAASLRPIFNNKGSFIPV